jgi:single-stranded DNA-binding protein
VTDRYYNNEEFLALGEEGRAKVYRLRDERDGRRNVASTGTTEISQLATAIIAATNSTAIGGAGQQGAPAAPANEHLANRNNPALQRTNQTNQNMPP